MKLAICIIIAAILGGLSFLMTQSYIPCVIIGVILGAIGGLSK